MIENKNPQEKLLSMLTEIYDQLEELEGVLENSLAGLRDDIYQQQTIQINKSEDTLNSIEVAYHKQDYISNNRIDIPPNRKKALKLELGY
jgi:hypothetical protein